MMPDRGTLSAAFNVLVLMYTLDETLPATNQTKKPESKEAK